MEEQLKKIACARVKDDMNSNRDSWGPCCGDCQYRDMPTKPCHGCFDGKVEQIASKLRQGLPR